MDEYIKREAAMDIFGDVPMWQGYGEPYPWKVHCVLVEAVKLVKEEISKIPAADVAPVRHGKWAHSRYENCSEQFEIVKCSCCGHEAYAMAFYVRGGNYCPNCGARMDGDDDAQTD